MCCCTQHFSVLRAIPARGVVPQSFPVFTAARYAHIPRALVVAWKERSRSDVAPILAAALAEVLLAALQSHKAFEPDAVTTYFVPIPSRPRTRALRGGDPLLELLTCAAHIVASRGWPCAVEPRLLRRVGGKDQVGLSAAARQVNAKHSYRLRRAPAPSTFVVLVDDILTTGATLGACRDLLSGAGVETLAAATLCATKVFSLPINRRSVGTPTG